VSDGAWLETPPVIFDGTKHYLDADSIKRTACGITLNDQTWVVDGNPPGFCWQCVHVNHLNERIKWQDEVLEAVEAWDQNPESGPVRGALAAAWEKYRRYRDFQEFGIE
jgi:hypothetical protein